MRCISLRVKKVFVAVISLWAISARAESTFPVAVGDTWQYEIAGSPGSTVTVRADGTEKLNDQELVRLETGTANSPVKTELVATGPAGLSCYQRTFPGAKPVSFDPPQLLIPDSMKVGDQWEMDDFVNGNRMHLQFVVVAEEDVAVPAGNFRGFRAQCEQPGTVSMTVERWFVAGVGMVKEVTSARAPGGRLLNRVTTALTKVSRGQGAADSGPAVVVPSSSPPPQASFKLEIAQEREGAPAAEIKSDAENIFVRWNGENLPIHSVVRIAWVAEDVGDVAWPNFVVDETKTEISTPTFGARFTLSRPKDGWAPGKYRVDLYLDDQLQSAAKVTIR
ncbi:MAG: hypothetical protein M3128_06665 [Verrucomicrobiota bacterium]|nr:hypothetical protein [Verrucomicrobiota bacterium]